MKYLITKDEHTSPSGNRTRFTIRDIGGRVVSRVKTQALANWFCTYLNATEGMKQ